MHTSLNLWQPSFFFLSSDVFLSTTWFVNTSMMSLTYGGKSCSCASAGPEVQHENGKSWCCSLPSSLAKGEDPRCFSIHRARVTIHPWLAKMLFACTNLCILSCFLIGHENLTFLWTNNVNTINLCLGGKINFLLVI